MDDGAGAEMLRRTSAHIFVDDLAEPVMAQRDVHHIADVLRLRSGEAVSVADGSGNFRICTLALQPRRRGVAPTLEPAGSILAQPAPWPSIVVAFAPTKAERSDWAVAKLVELGVDRIVPLTAARSVVRWDSERAERARRRWVEIALQAAMQCRRTRLPEIGEACSVAAMVAENGKAVAMAVPGGPPPSLRCPSVMVGPEGGWSPEEEALATTVVGLGPHILRGETATVAAGALYVAMRSGIVVDATSLPPEA